MADSSVQASDQVGVVGAKFSTDLVGGEHVPLTKLAFGAYGTVTLVDSTTTNPFPVALSDVDTAVLDAVAASLVTIDVDTDAIATSAAAMVVDLAAIEVLLTAIDLDTSNITACDTGAVVISSGTVTTVSTVTNLAQMGGVAISLNTGVRDTGTQRVTIATNDVVPASQSGTWTVDLSAGTALAADVGLSGARTSGGTTLYKNIDVDETEDQVKATAGQVYWIHAINLSAGVRYLKLYNATAAAVTVGTTVPDLTFPIPTQGDTNGAGFLFSVPNGIEFTTAITIASTTGVADNDSGAPGANDVVVNLGYA